MTLQLGMSREDRDPADVLTTWALKEYERLQQEAPPISGASIVLFNQKFDKNTQAIPDVAEDKFIIKVFNHEQTIKSSDIELVSPSNELNLEITNE